MMTMIQYNQKDSSYAILLINAHMAGNLSSKLLSKSTWIIDSGATDHVSISLTQMRDIKLFTSPLYIKLPNGTTVTVLTCGSVDMNGSLILYGVLYIPSFHYNLIYVSKLMGHSSTTVALYVMVSISCTTLRPHPSHLFQSLILLQLFLQPQVILYFGTTGWDYITSSTQTNQVYSFHQ